jgi:hypothetical protein
LIEWKDGSSDWTDLKDLKESNPVEIAEHAVANKIMEEPAFKWWVANVSRRRNRTMSKLKSRHWKTAHKFGIRVPKTVEEGCKIDLETGTDFSTKATSKQKLLAKGRSEWKAPCWIPRDWMPHDVRHQDGR